MKKPVTDHRAALEALDGLKRFLDYPNSNPSVVEMLDTLIERLEPVEIARTHGFSRPVGWCPNPCGRYNDDTEFCPRCGRPIKWI